MFRSLAREPSLEGRDGGEVWAFEIVIGTRTRWTFQAPNLPFLCFCCYRDPGGTGWDYRVLVSGVGCTASFGA